MIDIKELISKVEDSYTLMGTTFCSNFRDESKDQKSCLGCMGRVQCALKNVLKEVSEFNLVLGRIIGINMDIKTISPHLTLLAELLLDEKGGNKI